MSGVQDTFNATVFNSYYDPMDTAGQMLMEMAETVEMVLDPDSATYNSTCSRMAQAVYGLTFQDPRMQKVFVTCALVLYGKDKVMRNKELHRYKFKHVLRQIENAHRGYMALVLYGKDKVMRNKELHRYKFKHVLRQIENAHWGYNEW